MKQTLALLILLLPSVAFAQPKRDREMAMMYFNSGDFEKAVVHYEKVYDFDPFGAYTNYLACFMQLKDYDKAEKLVKKHYKKNPGNVEVLVDLGNVYLAQNDAEKANQQYDKAISSLLPDVAKIQLLGNLFMNMQDFDHALKSYEQGRKLLGGAYPFNFEVAEVYAQQGDFQKMTDEYLDLLNQSEAYLPNVQTIFQNKIAFDTEDKIGEMLRTALLRRIQKQNQKTIFAELLYWLFMQQKDFESAFIQARALDKRLEEDGNRILALGRASASNLNYETAESCFQYVISKGSGNSNFVTARIELINTVNQRITSGTNFSNADLVKLEKDYETALSELGKTPSTAPLVRGYAHLKAFYLEKIDDAVALLEETIEMPGIKPLFRAECKLELGDILIFKGEMWEATLLYSQVDKDFKHDAIGREAKFRNARLSYYMGEFDWAVAQLNVLKAATSQLISNDAMSLSMLISDNTGFDSIYDPLLMYSRGELLAYRHQYDNALVTLDSIPFHFPGHSLTDEVWYKKASVYNALGKFDSSAVLYQEILNQYPTDLLGDDALFKLASLHEYNLNNKPKAMELYEKLLTDYPGSLYVVEARKRFRTLRGDKVN